MDMEVLAMKDRTDLDTAIDARKVDTLKELEAFCTQPSISAHNLGIDTMMGLVKEALERRGFIVRVVQTKRHPALIAECKGRGDRSALFYNHYDVQPPEPLDAWVTPPFKPTIRDGNFYARGAMDDKGHLVCRLAAIDAIRDVYGELPCTVKFLIEGEEEISSPGLEDVIRDNAQALAADICLWEFGEMDGGGAPLQYLGFRGVLYVELSVQALSGDCHSGIWGSLLPNAAWRLTWALSKIKDADERIRIPGFYDNVLPPSPGDLACMSTLPIMPDSDRKAMGAASFLHSYRNSVEFYKNALMIPACTICGMTSGYTGKGQKTIIPAKASAKVDFRLVPDQTPDEILGKLRKYLDAEGFEDVKVECLGKSYPSRTPIDHPLARMVVESAREVYGQPQRVYPMSGGSGPAYLFRKYLGVPVLTAGVGYMGSNIHAPNENIRLLDFFNGIRHTARILVDLGKS